MLKLLRYQGTRVLFKKEKLGFMDKKTEMEGRK